MSSEASSPPPILALDTASPTVSLALGRGGRVLAARTLDLRQSSERLLASMDEILRQSDWHLGDLGGVVALRGPGSFTGLRIGLGTALGLHQALGLRATALPTLPVLARSVTERLETGDRLIAAVDALRGEWMAGTFLVERVPGEERPEKTAEDESGDRGIRIRPVDEPRLRTVDDLEASGLPVASLEVDKLTRLEPGRRLLAPPLAAHALAALQDAGAGGHDEDGDGPESGIWDPARLVQPIYFRPPAVTPPKRKPRPSSAGDPGAGSARPESVLTAAEG